MAVFYAPPLAATLLGWIKPPRSIPLVAFLATAETGFPMLLIGRLYASFGKRRRTAATRRRNRFLPAPMACIGSE